MPDIQHAIPIAASIETVYPLVATGKGFAQWWAADVTESAGAVQLGFFNRTTVYRLRLKSARPTSEVQWICETGDEWNGTHISFGFEARDSGTLVRFTHGGWRSASDYFISCNSQADP